MLCKYMIPLTLQSCPRTQRTFVISIIAFVPRLKNIGTTDTEALGGTKGTALCIAAWARINADSEACLSTLALGWLSALPTDWYHPLAGWTLTQSQIQVTLPRPANSRMGSSAVDRGKEGEAGACSWHSGEDVSSSCGSMTLGGGVVSLSIMIRLVRIDDGGGLENGV